MNVRAVNYKLAVRFSCRSFFHALAIRPVIISLASRFSGLLIFVYISTIYV